MLNSVKEAWQLSCFFVIIRHKHARNQNNWPLVYHISNSPYRSIHLPLSYCRLSDSKTSDLEKDTLSAYIISTTKAVKQGIAGIGLRSYTPLTSATSFEVYNIIKPLT